MAIPLLVSDALTIAQALIAPPWGVFLNGQPVIQQANQFSANLSSILGPVQQIASLLGAPNIIPATASTVEFHYGQDWGLPTYRQETGAFSTYNKITLPFDVKLRLASNGPASVRGAFLSSCIAIANSISLFDVVTPEQVFTSCNVEHIDWDRRADRGVELIVVDMWFKQIGVVGATAFTNTQQPGNAAPQSIGFQQAQPPSSQGSAALSSITVQ